VNIIFDFDGTIADSKDYLLGIYNSIASKSNRPGISRETFDNMSKMSIYERFKAFNTTLFEVTKIYSEIEKYYYEKAEELELFKGIKELIERLALNNRLYVLSTNTKRIIRRVLEKHSINGYFEKLYTNKNLLGKSKSLKRIIKTNQLKLPDTVYIGDEERDALASKKAGVRFIAVSWGFDSKELLESAGSEKVVDEPEELVEIIHGLET
jgi:phosphoglycolate phosphatase